MVAESYHRYIRQRLDRDATAATAARDLFVSGGGAHNPALMRSPLTTEHSIRNPYHNVWEKQVFLNERVFTAEPPDYIHCCCIYAVETKKKDLLIKNTSLLGSAPY